MSSGIAAIGNLAGKVNANNALLVALDGGVASATLFLAGFGTKEAVAFGFAADTDTGMYGLTAAVLFSMGGLAGPVFTQDEIRLNSSQRLSWVSTTNAETGTPDVFLVRAGANKLAMRNGTAAQTFYINRSYTDASNYERLALALEGTTVDIVTQGAGTGTARSLRFGVTDAFWQITSSGHLQAITDASRDIGASGATRPRDYYGSGKITSAGPTAGIGYVTGAGGIVTQATSKATAFTLSTVTGQITLAGDLLLASTAVSATWTNTALAAGDVVVLTHVSGGTAGSYLADAAVGAGSAVLTVRNMSLGNLTEAPVFGFVVVKGVTA